MSSTGDGPLDLKNPVAFRPTEDADLEYVLALEADPDTAPFIAPWPLEEHRAALADPTVGHWVLEDTERGVRVGFVILRSVGAESLELKRIAISEKGRGYGKDAMRLVKAAAFGELGATSVWLDVYDFNQRAQAVYEAEGFVVERSRPATEAGCASGTAYIMRVTAD
jgi:ribosomal protein S18 acetylase RimI-like enzyme